MWFVGHGLGCCRHLAPEPLVSHWWSWAFTSWHIYHTFYHMLLQSLTFYLTNMLIYILVNSIYIIRICGAWIELQFLSGATSGAELQFLSVCFCHCWIGSCKLDWICRGRLQTHWTRNCSLAAPHPCAAVPWRVHSRWPGCCRWSWTSWRSTCRLWTTFGATWCKAWFMWTKLHASCKPATRLKILYFFGWRMTRMPRQTNPFEKH